MAVTSPVAGSPPTPPQPRRPRSANPSLHDTPAEGLVLVVAPGNGRFHPAVQSGSLPRGGLLGRLAVGGGRQIDVCCPTDLVVRGLLARAGQLVMTGVALAWGEQAAADPAA